MHEGGICVWVNILRQVKRVFLVTLYIRFNIRSLTNNSYFSILKFVNVNLYTNLSQNLSSGLHKEVVTGQLRITVEYHTLTHSITKDQGN